MVVLVDGLHDYSRGLTRAQLTVTARTLGIDKSPLGDQFINEQLILAIVERIERLRADDLTLELRHRGYSRRLLVPRNRSRSLQLFHFQGPRGKRCSRQRPARACNHYRAVGRHDRLQTFTCQWSRIYPWHSAARIPSNILCTECSKNAGTRPQRPELHQCVARHRLSLRL